MTQQHRARTQTEARRAARVALLAGALSAASACLGGCDDRLPAFADPPPYDAGDSRLDAGDDDDAGGR